MTSPVIVRWDARLTNWALWYAGAEACGGGSAYDGFFEWEHPPRLPLPLVGEALDTNLLIQQLSDQHQKAIRAVYTYTGSVANQADAIGCTPDVMHDRCKAAMFKLDDLDQRRIRDRVHA